MADGKSSAKHPNRAADEMEIIVWAATQPHHGFNATGWCAPNSNSPCAPCLSKETDPPESTGRA